MRMDELGLEVKFAGGAPVLTTTDAGTVIEGYASLFGLADQGGDKVMPGAYAASLSKLAGRGDKVRMLWQHDPSKPIGVWDEIREDARGLWVRGRLLSEVAQAREAAALVQAGADGLGHAVVLVVVAPIELVQTCLARLLQQRGPGQRVHGGVVGPDPQGAGQPGQG